jgi:6-phosphogluconolactonase
MKFPARTVSALAVWALAAAFASSQAPTPVGAVFSMSNAASGNEILVFDRAVDGTLTLSATKYSTTGMGSGAALNAQGSLAYGRDTTHRWLAAVNSGSNDISLFELTGTSTLQLTSMVPSGGDKPVSVAIRNDVLYVLNAGNPNNITGFTIDAQGVLAQIPNSTQPLSAATTGPAQVGWSPDGEMLLVTEKQTDLIDLFDVDVSTNLATSMVSAPSNGPTPFGFKFRGPRQLLVSESFNGATDASSLSTYALSGQSLTVIDGSVTTTETTARWIATSRNRKFAYTANNVSNTITGFHTSANGQLTLLNVDGITATTGNAPADMATANPKYLYVLNSQDGTISGFKIDRNTGALTSLGTAVAGLPTAGAAGLVAF